MRRTQPFSSRSRRKLCVCNCKVSREKTATWLSHRSRAKFPGQEFPCQTIERFRSAPEVVYGENRLRSVEFIILELKGGVAEASEAAQTLTLSYKPVPGDRKSGMPAETEMPAPTRTTMFLNRASLMPCATPRRFRESKTAQRSSSPSWSGGTLYIPRRCA